MDQEILLFRKTCYNIGTRFRFIIDNKLVNVVISDVEIKYHKNVHYETCLVMYHLDTKEGYTFGDFSEEQLKEMTKTSYYKTK